MTTITLNINVMDEVEKLGKDAKEDFFDSIACQDQVIDAVVDQILDGLTRLASCGKESGSPSGAWSGSSPTALERGRRRILEAFPGVIRSELVKIAEEHLRYKQRNEAALEETTKYTRLLEGEVMKLRKMLNVNTQ